MDGARFDRVVRGVAGTLTRRRVVASIFGLAMAGTRGEALAAHPCHRVGRQCTRNGQCCTGYCETRRFLPMGKRYRCACTSGLHACSGACVDLRTDMRHCGACDDICVNGECIDGECRFQYL